MRSEVTVAAVMARRRAGLLGRARWSRAARREALYGYLFALPWILGFVLFVAGPLGASLYLGFCEYSIAGIPRFVGLSNYATALTLDRDFWPSLARTFYYVALTVPVGVVGSLLLAAVLNQGIRGKTLFRSLCYLPSLTPVVASVLLWKWILDARLGPVNYALSSVLGVEGPGWLASTQWAIPALAMIALWGAMGGPRMLIFLAGLQGVPEELYDAAKIDGANTWQRFRNVTLPMISPVMLFNLILGMIGGLKTFAPAFIGTGGGPGRATWFFALHIYSRAFQYSEMGYASALAWLFTALLLGLIALQFLWSRRWVYYAGEVR